MGVAEDQRPVGANQVDVAPAVSVNQERALTGGGEDGFAANSAKGADGAVDSSRQNEPGPFEPVAQLGEGDGAAPLGEAEDAVDGAGDGEALAAGLVELAVAIQKMVSPLTRCWATVRPAMTSPKML